MLVFIHNIQWDSFRNGLHTAQHSTHGIAQHHMVQQTTAGQRQLMYNCVDKVRSCKPDDVKCKFGTSTTAMAQHSTSQHVTVQHSTVQLVTAQQHQTVQGFGGGNNNKIQPVTAPAHSQCMALETAARRHSTPQHSAAVTVQGHLQCMAPVAAARRQSRRHCEPAVRASPLVLH